MANQAAGKTVPVALRRSYKKSDILSLQFWINGVEQDAKINPTNLDLKLKTIYYLRWYIAGKNEGKVTFRFILPKNVELRYPFVAPDKVTPEIVAAIGNHPLIKDTSGDQRFYLVEKKVAKEGTA